MFSITKKVYYTDVDVSQKMTLSAVVDSMQDAINMHSISAGRAIDYLKENGRAWFLVGWNIELKRLPGIDEDITIKTWPYAVNASMSSRNIIAVDSNDELVMCADSTWTLVDINTARPIKVTPEDLSAYGMGEAFPMEKVSRKIQVDREMTEQEIVRIRRTDIDYNGHVSNAVYIKLACDFLEDARVSRIRAEYKQQTKYGESLRILTARENDKLWVRFVGSDDGVQKSTVEFTLEA